MGVRKWVSACGGMAVAFGLAAAAQANVYYTFTITFQGTVTSGYDQGGLLGTTGASLAGDTYSAIYRVDNDGYDGDISTLTNPPLYSDIHLDSKSNYWIRSASIAIDGVKFITNTPYSRPNIYNDISAQDNTFVDNGSLQPVHYDVRDSDHAYGFFYDLGGNITTLSPTSVTVSYDPPVPEASSWIFAIAGLGMIGFAARRRLVSAALTA